jgi:hypothetical protein
VSLDCPSLDGTTRTITLGTQSYSFLIACSTDYAGPNTVDYLAIISYHLDDCLQACASLNRNTGGNTCRAVEFVSDMQLETTADFGNCWLKNNSESAVRNPRYTPNRNAGAVLVL